MTSRDADHYFLLPVMPVEQDPECSMEGYELTSALQLLSVEREATLFVTLHASLAVLPYRHAGQEEVVIGVPAGHGFRETLPLRLKLSGEPSFNELLVQARRLTPIMSGRHDTAANRIGSEDHV